MKKYNHAYQIGFSVESLDPKTASARAILNGLEARLRDLKSCPPSETHEAVGDPYDTYEIEPEPEVNPWGEDPEFSVEDWQLEVTNNDTRRGYVDWVKAQRESNS